MPFFKKLDYDRAAGLYDLLDGSGLPYEEAARKIATVFQKHNVHTLLDMACGTGNFTIPLYRQGYQILGVDFHKGMLTEARRKALATHARIPFRQGDMCRDYFGQFDGITCMFNAIGHLTPREFNDALWQFNLQLRKKGILVFDIFNFSWLRDHFTYTTFMDQAGKSVGAWFVRFNHNALDERSKVMRVHQHTFVQQNRLLSHYKEEWDMQTYELRELETLLHLNGFDVLHVWGDYSTKKGFEEFKNDKSRSITLVAQKNG
ncbi:MAG: class I SAM-dependent methyltransferase [Candidatus Diapherotrites archaeon]|nr:class I SAM-dependent methyltransferase [Candidatus Diapherotrites archaeon]